MFCSREEKCHNSYRVRQGVVDLCWVDICVGHSTTSPILLGQLEVWQKWLWSWAEWWSLEIKVNPTQVYDHLPNPVHLCLSVVRLWYTSNLLLTCKETAATFWGPAQKFKLEQCYFSKKKEAVKGGSWYHVRRKATISPQNGKPPPPFPKTKIGRKWLWNAKKKKSNPPSLFPSQKPPLICVCKL